MKVFYICENYSKFAQVDYVRSHTDLDRNTLQTPYRAQIPDLGPAKA